MSKSNEIKKEDFKKDIKNEKGFLDPLKKVLEENPQKKEELKKDSSK